ncbi:hypothetical protein ACFPIF_11615 [Brevundimonas faecalis]|uniref:hypothetical protein n=1 Tax=Brevundimonas faecalis TaxID=947378 RepID=UPI003605C2F8
MGKATNPRNRSQTKAGRPKAKGDRYACGKLKPQKPNERIVEIREAFGLAKLGQKFTPIEVAFARGWIDDDCYQAAVRYAALYRLASHGAPRVAVRMDPSRPDGARVRDLSFAHLTDKEVAAIWDSAMPTRQSPEDDLERRERATREWKATNAAMTPSQRSEVFEVLILDGWPQWIIQRAAGRFKTTWEAKRDLLVEGLAQRPIRLAA